MGFAPDGRDRFAHSDIVGDLYEKSGDGRPVILVEGTAAGVWSVKAGKGGAIEVELELFEKPAKKLQTALDERAEAVQAFLTE
jgi:winged helix DNA-binding protein